MFNKFIQRRVLSDRYRYNRFFRVLAHQFASSNSVFPLPATTVNYGSFPGSNGELMIKSVIIPLEEALNGVPGMNT
jgi:HAE1 family hydrophobic/amphiphilic exporter-1